MIAIAYLAGRRDSAQAEQRRRTPEQRLRETRQQLALVAAQAERSRLDPDMLFACMGRARDAYARDRDLGDTLLERLTLYLRATLGGAADGACTPGREATIAAARLDVERRDGDSPLALTIPAALLAAEVQESLQQLWPELRIVAVAADGVAALRESTRATTASCSRTRGCACSTTRASPAPVCAGSESTRTRRTSRCSSRRSR